MRDELLSFEQFDALLEAQVLVADWREEYNTNRPHSALDMPAGLPRGSGASARVTGSDQRDPVTTTDPVTVPIDSVWP